MESLPFLGFIAQVRNTPTTAIYCWACAPRLWHEELQDAYGNVVQPITEAGQGEVCSLCGGSIGEEPAAEPDMKTQMGRIDNPEPRMQNIPIRKEK